MNAPLDLLQRLLTSITSLQEEFSNIKLAKSLFESILAEALELTDSPYGLILEIATETGAVEYHTIKSHELPEKISTIPPSSLQPEWLSTIAARIRKQQSVLHNQKGSTLPLIINSIRFDSYLALPLRTSELFTEILILANREHPYETWEAEFLKPFLVTCSNLISSYYTNEAHENITRELKKSELFLHSIVENLPNMIFVKEAQELRFFLFNKAGEKLLGHTRDELLGKNDYDFFPPEQAEFFTRKDREVLEKGELLIIEQEPIKTKEGRRYLSTKKIPLCDETGKANYLLGISEDITELLATQESLQRAMQEANQASQAKSEFLANMSHEIRTPMNGVLGMTELLLETKLSEEQKHLTETIKTSGEALLSIINDILDFSKIEAGKLELFESDFSIYTVLDDVDSIFRSLAENNSITFTTTCSNDIPEYLFGDPLRLKQVLINLVGNAVKFTPPGGEVAVVVTLPESEPEALTLSFQVRDSGVGINEAVQQHIFEAFTQADSSVTRKFGGTGLGLAICAKLVTLMNGTISLESCEGTGSTFTFSVQLQPARDSCVQPEKTPLNIAADTPLSILLVEDNSVNQILCKKLLEQSGHRVTVATNGKEAIDAFQQQHFDIILMDIQMPIMDGVEASHAIRQLPGGEAVPIIAVTAHAMAEDRDKYLARGLDHYLSKPITRKTLFQVVHEALTSGRTRH